MDVGANLQTYQVRAHFEALDEGILLVPLDPRYTQVGFNLISVQLCLWAAIMTFCLFCLKGNGLIDLKILRSGATGASSSGLHVF